MTASTLPRLISIEELSDLLQTPVRTLYWWNRKGCGPSAYKIGRHLKYRLDDVEAWLETQKVAPAERDRTLPRRRTS